MKITIFGGSGLLGNELINTRHEADSLSCPTSYGINLSEKIPTSDSNDLWINCAAKVGGVKANTDFVGDFYDINSRINNNVFHGARQQNVKKLVSVLSTCIYPDAQYIKYPLTEDQLHNGPPHSSNFGYAYAKRMIDVQSRAYRQQWDCNFITVIPNNQIGRAHV